MASGQFAVACRQIGRAVRLGDRRRTRARGSSSTASSPARRGGLGGSGGAARPDGPGRLPRRPPRPGATSRTPSRPRSSSWSARPTRSGIATCSAAGSTPWRIASRGRRTVRTRRGGRTGNRSGPRLRSHASRTRSGLDLRAAVHAEVDRLPESYRVAVLLCDLQGRTYDEAARELGWPVGTVKGRLHRAGPCFADGSPDGAWRFHGGAGRGSLPRRGARRCAIAHRIDGLGRLGGCGRSARHRRRRVGAGARIDPGSAHDHDQHIDQAEARRDRPRRRGAGRAGHRRTRAAVSPGLASPRRDRPT